MAVNVKATVTVAKRPSGTFATIIPIAKTRLVIAAKIINNIILRYPIMKPRTKNTTPIDMAITAIYLIKTFNSLLRVVSSPPELSTNPAIYPITVLSPVKTTIPLPLPYIYNHLNTSLQRVPKKARFFVSKGLVWFVHSGDLNNNSDSPVRLELSTFISLLSKILISAGILLPFSITTTSPGTKFDAGNFYYYPSRITNVSGGIKFLKASIIASDFAF